MWWEGDKSTIVYSQDRVLAKSDIQAGRNIAYDLANLHAPMRHVSGLQPSHVGAAAAIGKRNGLDSVATTLEGVLGQRKCEWQAFRSLCRLGQEVRRLSNGTTKMTYRKGVILPTCYMHLQQGPPCFFSMVGDTAVCR
jgi:hypothetical protein